MDSCFKELFTYFDITNALIGVHSDYDMYRKTGSVLLYPKEGSKKSTDELISLLRDNSIKSRLVLADYYFVDSEPEKFRETIDLIYSKRLINASARSDIENDIKEIEKRFDYKTKIKHQISLSQERIIKDLFAKVYMPEIFNLLTSLDDFLIAIRCGFNIDFFEELLNENFQFLGFKTLLNDEQIIELTSYLSSLNKCYFGCANLESSLEQSGDCIPDLELQRNVIISVAKKIIANKFPDQINSKMFLTFFELNQLIIEDPYIDFYESEINVTKIKNKFGLFKINNFIRVLIRTINDTKINLSDLDKITKSEFVTICKQCYNLLENIENSDLTDEEREQFNHIYNEISEENIFIQSDDARSFSVERISLFNNQDQHNSLIAEIKQKSKNIISKNYLGSNGIFHQRRELIKKRKKCAEAVERRRNEI